MPSDDFTLLRDRLEVLLLRLGLLLVSDFLHLALVVSHVHGSQIDCFLEHLAHGDPQSCDQVMLRFVVLIFLIFLDPPL